MHRENCDEEGEDNEEDEDGFEVLNPNQNPRAVDTPQNPFSNPSSEEYLSYTDTLLSLQQIVSHLQDTLSSLQALGKEVRIARLEEGQHVHVFASAQNGSQRAFSSLFGIVFDITKFIRIGTSYSFVKHDQSTLYPKKNTTLGCAESKTNIHVMTCAITWNPSSPGVTALIEGTCGIGKAHNTRYGLFENKGYAAKGLPHLKTKGFSTRLGYALDIIPATLITPYIECTKIYGQLNKYKEKNTDPCLTTCISSNKGRYTEKTVGLHVSITPIDRLLFSIWIEGSHVQRKNSRLLCTILSPYKGSIKTPKVQKNYTQGKFGFSIDTRITDNFGAGIHMSILNNAHKFIEKDTIGIHMWYNF